ncbi:MAG: hypothetical protein E7354_01555 [Clostridiales bacterium]|nr:hypothetical protein [Clostridiales bacterium]
MKFSCVALNSNSINTQNQSKIIDYLKVKLYEIGESLSLISYFDNSLDNLKTFNIEKSDFVFVIGTSSTIYNNNIKENLCRIFSDKLDNFDASTNALKKYCLDNNIPFAMQEEMETQLPKESIPLCSTDYYNNGFMYKYNNTYLVYLPENLAFATEMYGRYVLPLINDLIGFKKESVVLKCFGILEKDIRAVLTDYFDNQDINIQIRSDDLDNAIYIRYDVNIKKSIIQDIVSDICNKLKKFIYATDDISIYDMALDLLSIRGKKIILAETLTFGNVTKRLSVRPEKRITDSFIFTNKESLVKCTKINPKVIETHGMYSVNTVYELANSLLELSNADISVFILGDTNESDICYIAIGDVDGIHVYKNKINDKSDNLIENISKTAIFYLIKKLKRNDLQI